MKRICLGDPPVVPLYLPYETTSKTTSVYLELPTDSDLYSHLPPGVHTSKILDYLPHDINSHAALQNKILRADLPSDVTAKLLSLYLYNQDKVTLHKALQNLAAKSPFEGTEPPKPVGFSSRVAIMSYTNKYYVCNENPADLRDLKY